MIAIMIMIIPNLDQVEFFILFLVQVSNGNEKRKKEIGPQIMITINQ